MRFLILGLLSFASWGMDIKFEITSKGTVYSYALNFAAQVKDNGSAALTVQVNTKNPLSSTIVKVPFGSGNNQKIGLVDSPEKILGSQPAVILIERINPNSFRIGYPQKLNDWKWVSFYVQKGLDGNPQFFDSGGVISGYEVGETVYRFGQPVGVKSVTPVRSKTH